ncbi:MAG: dTMP kinase, partial [Nanoarchaeota archaeon]
MPKNLFIVIEGTDGSGKATQVEALRKRVEEARKVTVFSFPRYNTPTGQEVRAYLNSKYGNPVDLNPYFASAFYGLDRAAASEEISQALLSGHVIADRYIGSNLGHQGAKLSPEERKRYVEWDEDWEFNKLKIPKPDLTVCLHVPLEETLKAMERQGRQRDGLEIDEAYMQRVIDTYLWLARTKPDWVLVDCMQDERRKTVEKMFTGYKIQKILMDE